MKAIISVILFTIASLPGFASVVVNYAGSNIVDGASFATTVVDIDAGGNGVLDTVNSENYPALKNGGVSGSVDALYSGASFAVGISVGDFVTLSSDANFGNCINERNLNEQTTGVGVILKGTQRIDPTQGIAVEISTETLSAGQSLVITGVLLTHFTVSGNDTAYILNNTSGEYVQVNAVDGNPLFVDLSSLNLVYSAGKVLGTSSDKLTGGQDFTIMGVDSSGSDGFLLSEIQFNIIPEPVTIGLFAVSGVSLLVSRRLH